MLGLGPGPLSDTMVDKAETEKLPETEDLDSKSALSDIGNLIDHGAAA
jgi:hypothetical protein